MRRNAGKLLFARSGPAQLGEQARRGVEVVVRVDDRADLDPGAPRDLARPDRSDLEVLALVDEPGRLVQPPRDRAVVRDLKLDLVPATQPPLGDRRVEERAADAAAAEALAHEQVAHPALERRVVQAPPEPMDDQPGRRAIGEGQEWRCVDVAHERLVSGAKRLGSGAASSTYSSRASARRIGEVVAAERAKVDAVRARDGEPADRTVRVPEMLYRPLKSGSRFSMKAAIPSFWSSEAKSR